MQIRNLGRTGLQVTNLCLGTMAFGRWIDEAQSARVLDAALDAGINFIDTADIYGRGMDTGDYTQRGESETILGHLLGERRHRIVLATKVRHRMGPGPNDEGLSRRHIFEGVDASLRRLRTDYIDLYQVHAPDPSTPLEETMDALDDLVRMGKVRYTGCSNFAAWQIAKANGLAERHGRARFVSVQPQYSLMVRKAEQELVPFCVSEGVGMIPYSPMARGVLTGKYRQGAPLPEGSRAAAGERWLKGLMVDENMTRVEAFRNLCGQWDLPMAQVAVAWVLHSPAVTAAIVGASRPEHLPDALAASDLKLSPEQMSALNELFA